MVRFFWETSKDLLVSEGGQNSGWAKTTQNKAVACGCYTLHSWTRDWTGDHVLPCFNCRSFCIFESVLSLWSTVECSFFHIPCPKKWDSKGWYNNQHWNGEQVGNESVILLLIQSCMTFAQNMGSPRKLRNGCSLRKDNAGICNRQIQYHSFCGDFHKWGYPPMDGL